MSAEQNNPETSSPDNLDHRVEQAAEPVDVEQLVSITVEQAVEKFEFHRGPLPPASQMEQYEKCLPGAADRILKMAENQSEHRKKLETIALNGQLSIQKRGQWFAFGISAIIIGAATWIGIATNSPAVAATIITSTLIGMATVFLVQRHHGGQPSRSGDQDRERQSASGNEEAAEAKSATGTRDQIKVESQRKKVP